MSLKTFTKDDPCPILLVEDDARLATLIQEYLDEHGIVIAHESRGDNAIERILNESPALVILDLMLPGRDGIEICRSVRGHYAGPILILTAKDEDVDQVVALELGADDYVTKPVEPRVLLARIRALLRRVKQELPPPDQALQFDDLSIQKTRREVYLGERRLEFTTNEFELLWLLACNAGKVLKRETVLATLRGIGYDGQDRSVDVCVSRLRKKLGDNPQHPNKIKTVRGQGYLFVAEAWKHR